MPRSKVVMTDELKAARLRSSLTSVLYKAQRYVNTADYITCRLVLSEAQEYLKALASIPHVPIKDIPYDEPK